MKAFLNTLFICVIAFFLLSFEGESDCASSLQEVLQSMAKDQNQSDGSVFFMRVRLKGEPAFGALFSTEMTVWKQGDWTVIENDYFSHFEDRETVVQISPLERTAIISDHDLEKEDHATQMIQQAIQHLKRSGEVSCSSEDGPKRTYELRFSDADAMGTLGQSVVVDRTENRIISITSSFSADAAYRSYEIEYLEYDTHSAKTEPSMLLQGLTIENIRDQFPNVEIQDLRVRNNANGK